MPIYSPTGFLDITNATLRTSNLETQNLKLNGGNITVTTEFTVLHAPASNTVQFSNVTTGFVTTANVEVGGQIIMGDHMIPSANELYDIGSASKKIRHLFLSDNSLYLGDNGAQIGADVNGTITIPSLNVSGTGALTVPSGTTGDRPATDVNGMIRYNTTTESMEAYSAGVWGPLGGGGSSSEVAPTITGISPVSVLLADTATQVFTATGTGIVSGSTVQLEGVDGTLYSVVDATPPNAAGTQVTFKMGSEVVDFPPSAMSTNTSITGYVASASYNSSTAFRAFNDVIGMGTNDYWNMDVNNILVGYSTVGPGYLPGLDAPVTQTFDGTSHRGHWIQLQIPSPVRLTRAVIGCTVTNRQYGLFVILGSTDNTDWTLLHAGKATTLSTDVTTLSTGSTKAFSYFRVVIKSKGSGTTDHRLGFNNIQFFGGLGFWDIAQQPYKVRINSTSSLNATSTTKIGFPVTWTTATGENLDFDTTVSATETLLGTDGAGGTNRTFSISPLSAVQALPSGLTLTGTTGAITGQIAAAGTTSVTFRLTDNASGLFTDRAINIVGSTPPPELYSFTTHTFTDAGQTGRTGPTITQARNTYNVTWDTNTNFFNVTAGIQLWTVPKTGTYEFELGGSRGGVRTNGTGTNVPGYGALIEGARLNLVKDDKLKILVGQLPDPYVASNGPGGGGGTFVTTDAATPVPYLVAGGGGGAHDGSQPNFPQTNNYGTASNRGPTTVATGRSAAGGGGGSFNGQGTLANFGRSFINGGLGGDFDVDGGFGGGGGAKNTNSYIGGGGGYSGGDELTNGGVAFLSGTDYGGGGSYENSSYVTGATLTTGGNNGKISGDRGYVKITFIS